MIFLQQAHGGGGNDGSGDDEVLLNSEKQLMRQCSGIFIRPVLM